VELRAVCEVLDVRERSGREVVERPDLVPSVEQELAQVRADEACTSGDEGFAHGRGGYPGHW
jgi:hypothetical protein